MEVHTVPLPFYLFSLSHWVFQTGQRLLHLKYGQEFQTRFSIPLTQFKPHHKSPGINILFQLQLIIQYRKPCWGADSREKTPSLLHSKFYRFRMKKKYLFEIQMIPIKVKSHPHFRDSQELGSNPLLLGILK